MEHLSIEKIIAFVTMSERNDEALRLASEVNTHIQKCPDCFALVDALLQLHDDYVGSFFSGSFREYLEKELSPEAKSELQPELRLDR